jgi:hypothetical protein
MRSFDPVRLSSSVGFWRRQAGVGWARDSSKNAGSNLFKNKAAWK